MEYFDGDIGTFGKEDGGGITLIKMQKRQDKNIKETSDYL